MLIQHQHKPEEFDPGHCRTCAREAGLLDHHDRVQREETRLRQTRIWAYAAVGTPSGRWACPAAASSWPRSPS
jgi:hypothetical protein